MGIFDYLLGHSPEKKIGKCFDKAVENAARASGSVSMIAGVMTFSAITKTYDSLKQDLFMMQQCGLSEFEYQQLLEKVLNKKGREYISNWDQIINNRQREDFNY